ncbi:MAG: energy transducer TonB [Bacteroidales bacterium]|nr:energy transducer TonB [Bacteroidales bacterium]
MEVKKSKSADLENKKGTSLLIGYVLVLAAMFVCFEWTERDKKIDLSDAVQDIIVEEEIVPITQQEDKLPPPPPEAPSVVEEIKVVDNDTQMEESSITSTEETNQAVEVPPVTVKKEEPKVEVEEAEDEQTIFQVVENQPEFPGGQSALMQYLSKNIKYPTISQENGVQGRVVVQFVVNKDGSIVDPVVARSVDPYLDKEAIRVVTTMPKWKPGMQRGKPVRVRYTLPVAFKLQ